MSIFLGKNSPTLQLQSCKVANMLIILMLAKRDFGTLQVQKE